MARGKRGKLGKRRQFTFTPIDGPPPPRATCADTFRERYGEEAMKARNGASARGCVWPLSARFEQVIVESENGQEREGSQGEKDGQDTGDEGSG